MAKQTRKLVCFGLVSLIFGAHVIHADPDIPERLDNNIGFGISSKVLEDAGKRPRIEMPDSDLSLIDLGKKNYEEYRSFIAILEHYYGVDAELLMGIWGIETHFGQNVGRAPIGSALRSFSTQNPSKREFARQQLASASRLVKKGIIDPNDLVGSYAGALGQTQFIPTSYERFGVDGDGNGTIDLWTAKDALASTANYMNAHGWTKSQPWGFAVNLPAGFFEKPGNRQSQPVEHWKKAGVTPKYVTEFFEKGTARVERFRGGDYLLFDNFYHILKYNASREYAFSVVALGDQILYPDRPGTREIGDKFNAGANIRAGDAPKTKPAGPCNSKICGVQLRLKKLGYYHGPIDGDYGSGTKSALGRFIRDNPGQAHKLMR